MRGSVTNEQQLQRQLEENLQKQRPILDWLDQAEDHLSEVAPEEIADIYTEMLRSVVGGVYSGGWKNPHRNAEWWAGKMEQFANSLRSAK